ncbi:DUF3592 domain-containing protein [Lentzea tibetensis]|uniref:DUF3592 domain-containing protein n=1 Tax=Lentzea tibetensis TaxID=2591470 RepID=A0A563ERW7_9PSEU|nr:DUF3592 domain-containing protein [Lentzea tibetensis]TWP50278.1 DUF3592 domain-containing protein [Lentzea tibetensis]
MGVVIGIWAATSLAIILLGVARARRNGRIDAFGMTVEGTVVDNKQGKYPVVRYRVGDEKFTKVGRAQDPLEMGSKVEVRYDPTRPSVADVDEPVSAKGYIWVGALSIAVLVAMFVLSRLAM